MSWVKHLADAVRKIADIEKLGIFSFMVIIVSLIIYHGNFFLPLLFYSFGFIALFFYYGLHKIKSTKIKQHPLDSNREISEVEEGYDFFKSYRFKDHPYNFLKKLSFFFFSVGTIILILGFIDSSFI